MEATEEKMSRFEYRVEAAHHQRLGFYLVYVIRLDDLKTIVRTAYSKKEVSFIAYASLKKLGYNGGITLKDVTWRSIGSPRRDEKKIIDVAPPLVEISDVQEHDESDTGDKVQGISEEQLETGGLT